MDESAAAAVPAAAGIAGRRLWLAPASALGVSVTAGLGLVSAAVLSVAPADRVLTAVWISVAVVAACTAIATAVHFRGLLVAEQQRAATLASRLTRSEARPAATDPAAATEQHTAPAGERGGSAALAANRRSADSRGLPPSPAAAPSSGPFGAETGIGTDLRSRYLMPPVPDGEPGRSHGAADGSNHRGDRHDLAGNSSGRHPGGPPADDATTTTVLPKLRRGRTPAEGRPGPGIFGGAVPPEPEPPNPSSASSLGAFQRAVTGRARDGQPFGEPISALGNGATRGARHATTTDRENHR